MKIVFSAIVTLLLLSGLVLADGLDGKWLIQRKVQTPSGDERTIETTLAIKVSGNTFTGTVSTSMMGRNMSSDIKDGKIDGNKFSFSNVVSTPRGEFKSTWEGTFSGNTIKGTQKAEGRDRVSNFEGKRQ